MKVAAQDKNDAVKKFRYFFLQNDNPDANADQGFKQAFLDLTV